MALPASLSQAGFGAFGGAFGNRSTRRKAIPTPRIPIPIQNPCQGTPALMIGPTANWPAEPPAIPNICVAPMRVAARLAGKFVVAM
jgi:hypothetical protein